MNILCVCPFCGKPFANKMLPIVNLFDGKYWLQKQAFYCDKCHAIIVYDPKAKKVTATKLKPNDKNYHMKMFWKTLI